MNNIDQYIDDLFREKLTDGPQSIVASNQEWIHLKSQIRRKKFFRFSTTQFNIYTLSFSVLVAGTILTWFVLTKNNIQQESEPKKEITTSADTVLINNSTKNEENNLNTRDSIIHQRNITNELPTSCQKNVTLSTSKPVQLNKPCMNDSVASEKIRVPICYDSITKIQEPVKTMKTDTIIFTDTIRVQKKGLKLKRKSN
jgi:hypothetical protein